MVKKSLCCDICKEEKTDLEDIQYKGWGDNTPLLCTYCYDELVYSKEVYVYLREDVNDVYVKGSIGNVWLSWEPLSLKCYGDLLGIILLYQMCDFDNKEEKHYIEGRDYIGDFNINYLRIIKLCMSYLKKGAQHIHLNKEYLLDLFTIKK